MTDQTPTCPTCGIDLRYPTGLHLVDCPATQTDQTPSTEQVERARFNVSNVHHSIGTECLCGARRLHKNRDRTEHILDAFLKELDLAAHDREVAAQAVRDVATSLRDVGNTVGDVYVPLIGWLDTRADRIEAGA